MSQEESKSHQLPSSMVSQELGEVNILVKGDVAEVLFTVLMEPSGEEAEGWETGVALDASISMKWAYGKKLEGKIPPELMQEYSSKGWIEAQNLDGLAVKSVNKEAKQDAIARGFLKNSENIMQSLGRNFIEYLSSHLDAHGKTTVVYWACNEGSDYEVIGEIESEACPSLKLEGPVKHSFGKGTNILPVLKYYWNRFEKSKRAMAIFLTDGHIEDFGDVKNFSIEMAKAVEAQEHGFMKCVLVGVGEAISLEQMEELDDLDTGTSVDIWDHKIAKEMRSLLEIFAEVVDENKIVAPTAMIYDDQGNLIKKFADGMPAKVVFEMPVTSKFFDLVVGESKIRQTIQAPQE
ncbi:MAG: VWA domain-containing protein [Candidatus Brocadiae bacterium]|nr:VWA domain-containing protein [Candidatus Brocadiia bacterium]